MRLAVIGAGRRITGVVRGMCAKGVEIGAIADPAPQQVRRRLEELGLDHKHIRFFDDAQTLIDQVRDVDGFAIGTRCHQHAPLATLVAQTGKPLFLEKPVAIDEAQLNALAAAWKGREDQVLISFPLRVTPVFEIARQIVRSGRLGVINQVQAVNNVSYGDVYYASWYRRFPDAGGLWLQKATHDFDYLNVLVQARPVRVAAMMTRRIFGTGQVLEPDRPAVADVHLPTHAVGEDLHDANASLQDEGSRFHTAIRNQDAGSAIVWYDNGIIVSYSQNFVPRRSAGTRGATVIGYNGTVKWDWHPPEQVRVVDHYSDRVDQISCPTEGGHGGGDAALEQMFVDMMQGKPNTGGNLTDGLLSVAMCLAARRAAQHHTVESILDFGIYPAAPDPIDPTRIESSDR